MCYSWQPSDNRLTGGVATLEKLALTKEVFLLARQLGVRLAFSHVASADNESDEASRDVSHQDVRLRAAVFAELHRLCPAMEVDWFASAASHHLSAFVSRYPCPGASGVDAFTYVWSDHPIDGGATVGFFNPPHVLLPYVVSKLLGEVARGVLIVPLIVQPWPAWRVALEPFVVWRYALAAGHSQVRTPVGFEGSVGGVSEALYIEKF